MKRIITCMLAALGLTAAYGQQNQQSYEVDTFKTKSGKTIRFHALVHASIRVEYDGKEIEIDPVTKLGNRTVDFTAISIVRPSRSLWLSRPASSPTSAVPTCRAPVR